MAGFDRFNKVWSDTGVKLPPSDAQASAGFAYLGPTPPSVELFNGINSDLDEKDNWLYNQLASVMTAGGSGPPSAADPNDLRDAIMNLISGAAVPAGTYVRIIGDTMTGALTLFGDATAALHAVPLQQLQASIANYVLKAGDIMTGTLINNVSIQSPFIVAYPASGAWSNSAISVGGSDTNSWKLSTDNTGNLHIIPTIGGVAGLSYYIVPDTGGGGAFNCPDVMRVGTKRDNFFYLQSNASASEKTICFTDPAIGGSVTYQELIDAISITTIANVVQTRHDSVSGFTSISFDFGPEPNWRIASDASIKKDIADYTTGLDKICQLRPVSFKYNDALPKPLINDGETHVGLMADEVEVVFPDMVKEYIARNQDDGIVTETPLKALALGELTFAYVNAFKEIQVRLTALETTAQPRRS